MNISSQDFIRKLRSKKYLPDGLVVEDVTLSLDCATAYLPNNLTIKGVLDLDGCINLTHLPSGLVVEQWLDIRRCPYLTNLPIDLIVGDGIYCDEDLIDRIPEDDLPLYINFKFNEEHIYEYLTSRLQNKTLYRRTPAQRTHS